MVKENRGKTWDKLNSWIKSTESLKFLKSLQHYSLVLGLGIFLLFAVVVFLPVSRAGIAVSQSGSFSEIIIFLEFAGIFILAFFLFITFLNKSIRSRSEEQEEQLRKKLRKIDYEINVIHAKYEYIDDRGEEQQLSDQLTDLRLTRSALIIESPQGWKQDISTKWGKTLVASHDRLLDEENRLRRRNRVNLLFGIVAALIGASFFIGAGIVSYYDKTLQNLSFSNFPFYYLLCIPITIISEVVAIFFLRLFALTEQSIERNKNEMTNIELRLTASQLLEDKDKFDSLADTLSNEERNFVLKKNETSATADIDKVDIDRAVEIAIKAMKAGIS